MDRCSVLPDDPHACRELLRRLQQEYAALQQQHHQGEQQRTELQHARRALQQECTVLQRQRAALTRELDEKGRVLDQTAASYAELQQQYEALRHELELFRRWVYGARRERITDAAGQQHLFELPAADQTPEPEPEEEDATEVPRRKKRRRKRKLDLDRLPQRRIEHDLPPEEKQCGTCGREMTKIGTDESLVLNHVPAVLEVEVHVQPKYACSCCKTGVVSPPPPARVLPRSIAGPGLIAEVLVSKFGDHLPLYRQEDIFARHGLHIPRSTLCDWVRGAADLLRPLYDLQKQRVLGADVVWTDDTSVRLLDREAQGGSRKGRFWTYIAAGAQPYSVYDFTPTWQRDGPATFLAEFQGYLHGDAYGGYDGIVLESDGRIVKVACGAHLRRKFVDARSTRPRECAQFLEWFRQLYDVEDRARELAPAERQALRATESVPVLDRMEQYLDELSVAALPKSPLGKALVYARNQWPAFRRYTEDGRLTIDNNVSERTLRAQAIGRKNWLFLGHAEAGPRASVLYTILAGAKRHRLEPWAYLTHVLLHVAGGSADLESLLPDRWAVAHPKHVLAHRLDESRQRQARQQRRRAERRRASV
jgi:transposase